MPSRRALASRLSAASLALLVAGCTTLAPRLAAPEVRIATLRIVRVSPPFADVEVGLAVTNPNAADIALDALDARVVVEGDKVADARLSSPVVIAAGATTVVALDARADLAVSLRVAARALAAGASVLHYELTGVAAQAGGSRWPFSRRGEIRGSQLAGARQ